MACCVLTAFCMSRLIRACEFLDIDIIKIQYNDFHDGLDEIFNDAIDKKQLAIASKITIEGMTCAACVTSIENAVGAMDGVERVTVSLPLSRATVVHKQGLTVLDLLSAIEARGYGARAGERTAEENLELLEHGEEIRETRTAFTDAAIISSVISGLECLFWLRIPLNVTGCIRLLVAILAIWIQLVDAVLVHKSAWRGGFTTSLTMNTLVSLSLALGMALSAFNIALFGLGTGQVYWSSISFLTTVLLGGRLLDLILRKQSSSTFAELYQLQAKSIVVKLLQHDQNGGLRTIYVNATTLQPGDEIEIGTGTPVPCDCYVLGGESLIDQSTMTGESIPVLKKPGDFLMSGTQNLSAQIIAVVYKNQEDSALEHLISSISVSTENSTSDKSAELVVSRFVSVILVLALTGFAFTLRTQFSAEGNLSTAINAACERAMAILASACPCALGLATPSAVLAGLDACRIRGLIIKKGLDTFRTLSELTHIVLDKTGTLTTGQLSVAQVDAHFNDWCRLLICAAERDNAQTHPVAQAVFQWAFTTLNEEQKRRVSQAKVIQEDNGTGNGVEIHVQIAPSERHYTIHAGSERFLREHGLTLPESMPLLHSEASTTSVYLAVDHHYAGSLQLQDRIRNEAAAVINELGKNFNLKLALLTGDVECEAQRVSKALGIQVVSSHSLPIEKKCFIQRVQDQSSSNQVAMVGDGLNDSPALAAADVGMCLSLGLTRPHSISESTNSQVSDVMLTSPNLCRLPELLHISRKTIDQSNWNMRWAIGYNLIAVALAMGIAEPVGLTIDAARAGTMMAFSSISVLAWSLWLRHDLSRVSFQPGIEMNTVDIGVEAQ